MHDLNNGWGVLTAWAESCRGPGWRNRIVWVLLQRQGTNERRLECVQPEDQTADMLALFDVSAACTDGMTRAVAALMVERSGAGDDDPRIGVQVGPERATEGAEE